LLIGELEPFLLLDLGDLFSGLVSLEFRFVVVVVVEVFGLLILLSVERGMPITVIREKAIFV